MPFGSSSIFRTASIALLSLITTSLGFSAPITGVTVTTSMGSCCGEPIENLTNGSGLSSYSTSASHVSVGSGWIGISRLGSLDFNLNGTYSVSQIAVWNHEFGVSSYSLASSTDGVNFTLLPGFPVSLAKAGNAVPVFAEVVNFSPVIATHMRMNILGGHALPHVNSTSLKEVMFVGDPATLVTVPEPGIPGKAGLAAMALGALWMGVSRKRAQAQN